MLAPVMVCAMHTVDLFVGLLSARLRPGQLALSQAMLNGSSMSEAVLSLKPQYMSLLDLI